MEIEWKRRVFCFFLLLFPHHSPRPFSITMEMATFTPFPSLNTHFPLVRVITLPTRIDYVRQTMDEMGIEFLTFPAILGKSLDKKDLIKRGILAPNHEFRNNNEIACALSHLQVLQEFADRPQDETVFVFEDDVVPSDYQAKVARVMATVPDDWELINFGRCWDACEEGTVINESIRVSKSSLCAHSYAVSKAGARKILRHAFPMQKAVDVYYLEVMQNQGLVLYTATPRVFNQRKGIAAPTSPTSSFRMKDKTAAEIDLTTLGNHYGCPECSADSSHLASYYKYMFVFFCIALIISSIAIYWLWFA